MAYDYATSPQIPLCNACLNCVEPSLQYLVAILACMAILHTLWLWLSNNAPQLS